MGDDSSDALPPGHRIAQYRIDAKLGRGGFGITYLAWDERLHRHVALKEYFPGDWVRRDKANFDIVVKQGCEHDFKWGLNSLRKEAVVLKQIDHDNVVKVFEDEDVEAHGTLYIPMAYYHGAEPLNARLGPQGTLDEAEVRQHVLPIMDGLEAVHREGVLHRDIKPSNILLVSDGTGVLIDFGSARPRNLAESGEVTMVHTPSYAAFEQRVGASERAATDIYGLGAVLYRCVTGQRPWDPLRRADDDRMPRAGDAGRDGQYSRELLRMIDAALEVKPSDRPQSVAEWRRILAVDSVRARGGGTSRAVPDSAQCSPPAIDTGDVSGIDPELMSIGTRMAGYYLEGGVRKFADFAARFADDVGDEFEKFRPYLRNFYNGARDWPGTDYTADMSTPDEITAWYEGRSDADATQTGGLGDVLSDTDRTEPAGGGEAQQGRDVEDNADYQYVRGLLAHREDDWEEAESWYMRAAEQNHPKAQFDLGMMYFHGEIEGLDVGEDVQHAVSYCMDAAANGLDGAKAFLGRDTQAGLEAYRRGDHHQAELEFRRLAETYSVHQALREPSRVLGRECGEAQFMLAQMCVHRTNSADLDDREAFDQAAEWLRGAARNGCGRAESWLYGLLGGHARWWLSVEQIDLEDLGAEGLDWYWKAAERTPAEQYDLGLRSEGDPDHACCEEASFWYRLAAEQGYVEAQFRLGLLTYCGVDGWHLEDSWIYDFDVPVRDLANVMLGSLLSEPSGPQSGGFPSPTDERIDGEGWLCSAARNGHSTAGALIVEGLRTIPDGPEGIDLFFLLGSIDRGTPSNVPFPDFAAKMQSESAECTREPRLLAGLYRSYREAAAKADVSWAGDFSTDAEIETWYASRSSVVGR